MLLTSLSLAWLLGILSAARISPSPITLIYCVVPLAILAVPRLRRFALRLSLIALLFFCGATYAHDSGPQADGCQLSLYNGREVALRAVISSDPEVRDANIRIRLSAEDVEMDGVCCEVAGDLIIYVPCYPEYAYGDFLELKGELTAPAAFDGFDYAGYLADRNVYSLMYYPEAIRLSSGNGNRFLSGVYQARRNLAASLARTLPEPQAALTQGILLGMRANIPDDVTDSFTRSGTMHLLAISGLNLTLIAGLLVSLLIRLLGRRHYLYVWLAAGIIWLYVLLCGASPSVVRAAIMATIFLAAELAGRQKRGGPALFLAAAVMVGFNPKVVRDVSFQLSFLSMCGLIYVYPLLHEGAKNLPARISQAFIRPYISYILDNLTISLSAMAALWPFLMNQFGAISIAGPAATVLAAFALPPIILLGFATAATAPVLPALAFVFGAGCWLLSSYIITIAGVFSFLPVVEISSLDSLVMPAYYTILAVIIWRLSILKRRKLAAELIS